VGDVEIINYLKQIMNMLRPVIPNRAVKFEVDLSVERVDRSLVEEGLIPAGKEFLYLTVVRVGTGMWSLKQRLLDGSTIEYTNDELSNGYVIVRSFTDIIFTNPPQSGVQNPRFIVEWYEKLITYPR